MFRTFSSILIIILSFNTNSFSQFFLKQETRNVVVSNNDTVIKCNILNENKKIKKRDRYYYWYQANKIHVNQNDYSGKLLHGNYFVYNTKKLLLVKGLYRFGLKDGTWKDWDKKGHLTKISNWKNGKLNGKTVIYKNGKTIKIIPYKNGIIHGKIRNYRGYKITTKKYRKGKEVKKRKREKVKKNNIKKPKDEKWKKQLKVFQSFKKGKNKN